MTIKTMKNAKRITLGNPASYKTQEALVAKLKKVSQTAMEVRTAVWLSNVRYVLINKFKWNERDACQFVAMWSPKCSAYAATA